MQVMPVDVTAIVAIISVFTVIGIPVLGLTARFALKPTVEALGRFFEVRGSDEVVSILERRVALLEQEVDQLRETVEFDRQLYGDSGKGESPPKRLPEG